MTKSSTLIISILFTSLLTAGDSFHQTITTQNQVEVPPSISHPKPNVKLSAISAFHLWNNAPIKSISIQAAGQWEELSILVEPVIVNEPYGSDILGVDYTRSGISGRITNAFVRYENDLLTFQLGRAPVHWGSIISSTGIDIGRQSVLPSEALVQNGFKSNIENQTSNIENHKSNIINYISPSPMSHLPFSMPPPSYDHFDMQFKFGQFRLEIFSGQLGSEELSQQSLNKKSSLLEPPFSRACPVPKVGVIGCLNPELVSGKTQRGKIFRSSLADVILNGNRIKRNIAGHRLTWLSKNKKLFASFGEQIIYTGISRGFEWHYLNPFVPYFFTALEADEESSETGDNDNSILFATFRYVIKPNLSIFGELLVDDFQVDDNNYQDGLGFQIGADGAIKISEKTITWSLDWTRINSWTYIHHGQFTSWQNRGHSLGYPYGPDLNSVHIQADIEISKSLSFNIEADWLEKGSNTLFTPWGNADNKDEPFPKPPVTHHSLLVTSLSWYWKYGILEAGWSNYDFPNKIAFNDPQSKTEGSLFLNVQFFYTLDFNL